MRVADPSEFASGSGDRRRVVIAGGGYAGMTLATTLAHRMKDSDNLELVLIDPRPYQQALSELDLVAAGQPRPQFAELWHQQVFRDLPISVVYNRLERVNPEKSVVSIGPRGRPIAEIGYWRLVIATGAVPKVPPIPGLAEHALTMWSVHDALELQARLQQTLGRAARLCTSEERCRALSVTVVGGGATGLEILGTLAYVLPREMSKVGLDPSDLRITLLEGTDDILWDLEPSQREKAKRRLRDMNVNLVLGEKLASVEADFITTETGRVIPSVVVVWCGGAHADPDAVDWGLEVDDGGRVVCDTTLRVLGHPEIYAIGDVSSFRDEAHQRGLPMLAQFAIHEGERAADNILAEARGQELKPFSPNQHGEFVSVGLDWGVGWMFGRNVSGRFAIFMKRLTYIVYWLQVGSYKLARLRTRQMLRMYRR